MNKKSVLLFFLILFGFILIISTMTKASVVDVPLGVGIANGTSGFDIELKQPDIPSLRTYVITFNGNTYNTHDEIVLGRSSPSIATATTEGQKDFGTDVVMKLAQTGIIKYIYAFDTPINLSTISSINPLKIIVLGKSFNITRINSQNSIVGIFDGETTTKTYLDGDPYIGEDKVNPKWVWSINIESLGSYQNTSVSRVTNLPNIAGIELGVKNYFTKQIPSDNPAKVGECYSLPNNYLSICLDNLTVNPTIDYAEFKIEYLPSVDLSSSGLGSRTSVPIIHMIGPSDGFVLKLPYAGAWVPPNLNFYLPEDTNTSEIWLYTFGSLITGAPNANYVTGLFFKDSNNNMIYAGNLSLNTLDGGKEFARINYKNLKNNNVSIIIDPILGNSPSNITLTVSPMMGRSSATWNYPIQLANLTTSWGLANGNYNSLGAFFTTEEASEIKVSNGPSANINTVLIGTWDKDVMNSYGFIIKNPKFNGAADRVVLMIPSEQQMATVSVDNTTNQTINQSGCVSPRSCFGVPYGYNCISESGYCATPAGSKCCLGIEAISYGYIQVSTGPTNPANIYLDNSYMGQTPMTFTTTTGTHAVKVTKSGYYDYVDEVPVLTAQTTKLSIKLVPISTGGPGGGSPFIFKKQKVTETSGDILRSPQTYSRQLSIVVGSLGILAAAGLGYFGLIKKKH